MVGCISTLHSETWMVVWYHDEQHDTLFITTKFPTTWLYESWILFSWFFLLGQRGTIRCPPGDPAATWVPRSPGDQRLLREREEQERRELHQSVEGEGARAPKEWLRMAEVSPTSWGMSVTFGSVGVEVAKNCGCWRRRTSGHSCLASSYDGQ